MEYFLMVIVGFLLGIFLGNKPSSDLTMKEWMNQRRRNKIKKLQESIDGEW